MSIIQAMHLEPFNPEYAENLKNWPDAIGNKYVRFYLNSSEWLKLIDNKQRYGFAAVVDDKMVGFADIEFLPDTSAAIAFGLAPQERGRGLGKELLSLIETFVKEHGIETIVAGVENDNVACLRLLEKSGFQAVHDEGEVTTLSKSV